MDIRVVAGDVTTFAGDGLVVSLFERVRVPVAVAVLVPFGFSRADALAYILISQILNYLVVTFWGVIGLWRMGGRTIGG